MRISLVSTGEEILCGEVLDTNAPHASTLLADHGFSIVRRHTCGDSLDDLTGTFRMALEEADAVICCGGLGPTVDDRSAEAAAAVLGRPLVMDKNILEQLEAKFEYIGVPFTGNQARQARLPEGAEAIDNWRGTAPGIACAQGDKLLFCLPGPPGEYRPMLEEIVLPRLEAERARRGDVEHSSTRIVNTFGKGEGWVADKLGDLESEVEHLQLGYRAAMPEIHIKLHTRRPTREEVEKVLDRAERLVRDRLGIIIFGIGDQSLPGVTLDLLIREKLTLAVAESCTGGLVGKLLTDVPGSSAAFLLSAVTYADQAKQDVLSVDPALLAEHGAVSEECARAMAEGVRDLAGSDLSVAVTGIAGPEGGSTEKPVGTVIFAFCGPEGTRTKKRTFPPLDRSFIRNLAAHTAIDLIRRQVLSFDKAKTI